MWQVRIRIRHRSNFEHFQQIQNSTNVLSALLSNANLWKNLCCSLTDFIRTESRARECRQTSKFNLSHKLQLLNVQHNFCSVMCYTVLIWTLILLTLGNKILLQSFNWPKPVYYGPTDKINASIRIRQILKVKILIRRMWIFTIFVTSLPETCTESNLIVAVYSAFLLLAHQICWLKQVLLSYYLCVCVCLSVCLQYIWKQKFTYS